MLNVHDIAVIVIWFLARGETGVQAQTLYRAQYNANELNLHMTQSPKSDPTHNDGRQLLSPLRHASIRLLVVTTEA